MTKQLDLFMNNMNPYKPPKRLNTRPLRYIIAFGEGTRGMKDFKEGMVYEMIRKKAMLNCDYKIGCIAFTSDGDPEELDISKAEEPNFHNKIFRFRNIGKKVMIVEKIIYCASNGLEFLDEKKIQIGPTKHEQVAAFKDFFSLIKDAEEINGFPINHYKHSPRLVEPEYARLLIKIFNQKIT